MATRERIGRAAGTALLALALGCEVATEQPAPVPPPGAPESAIEVKAVRVELSKPVRLVWEGEPIETTRLVEFVVTTPIPVPVESRSPVLRLGDHLLGYGEYLAPTVLRFTEFRPQRLPDGAVVKLQMGHDPAAPPLYVSSFVYRAAGLPVEAR